MLAAHHTLLVTPGGRSGQKGQLWANKPDLLPRALRDSPAAYRLAVVTPLAELIIQANRGRPRAQG